MKFDGEVVVTNRHLLRLALTVGSDTKQAPAVTGSGRDLLFAYTVEASDLDDDGISIPADPLSLNGGAITVSGDPMTAVTLTHSGIADDATQKVNGSAVVAPTVQTILFLTTPVTGDTFRRGETITVAATFDTAVIVRGDPQFALTIGTNVRNASREYSSGSASVSVSFSYTVKGSDVDTDGISVAANALSLNGGAIELADGTTAADITHAAVAADSTRKVDGTLDVAPTVTSVYVHFQPDNETAYQLGEEIRARADFDSAIEVTGQPQLALTIGMTTRQATYSRTWGDIRMEFLYTVQASDMDNDGISISANALTLNGGTIKRAAGTSDAVLTHAAADADPKHQVDGGTFSAPQVTSVGFSFHPDDGQTYVRGETIYMSVQFDRMAEVTGSPRVALTIGTNTRYATYDSVSTTRPFRLRFVYTVQASDMDADGISIPADAVELNGGAITLPGVPTVAAVLTHSQVDNDPMRKVDGSSVPMVNTVAFLGTPDIGTTYTAGETIGAYVEFEREVDVTGTPQLALAIGANTRQASFLRVWESNASFILFTYIVQTSDTDADGINFPANALSLNGGTITLREDATTDAVLTHSATAADGARKVDGGGTPVNTDPPTVESVAVKSAPQSGDTYGWGETIVFTLTFSQKVRVTGQPQPTLAFDLGRSTREARYTGITDTDVDSDPRPRPRPEGVKVHFAYTVQPGDSDSDGIQVGGLASAIDLGGARIQSAADLVDADGHKVDGVDADLAHAALGRLPGHKVDGGTAQPPAGSGITIIDTHGNPLANNRLTIRESTRGRYGLKLNTRPTHTVRVAAIASDGDPDLQVLPTANGEKAITPDEWETPFYLELRAAIDDDEETGERVFLNRSFSSDPAYHDLVLPDVVVVEDERSDDAGALSVADAEATEGVDDTLDFVVKLDRRPSLGLGWEVTVDYRTTQDGRAMAGSDYTSTSGTLTFAPGEDKKTVSVPIMDDAVEDDGETFTLVLSNAFNAGFARNGTQAVGTIRNTEPLTATFPESVYASAQHTGPSDRPQVVVAFSAPVAAFGADTPSVSATGASVDGVQRLDKEGLEHAYVFFLTPEGQQAIVFRLHANRACTDGGICTADRRRLSNSPSATIPGPSDDAPEPNTPATGAPTISGTPQVGEALSASTSGISDADGLDDASFGYQWIRASADIDGATGATYTPVDADEGERLTVRVSFTDDAGHAERLTSAATDAVAAAPESGSAAEPLTAAFEGVPAAHDGETAFRVRLAFSEGISISYTRMRDASFTVTGGDVTQARRVDGRRDLWEITIEPDADEAVTVRLPETTDCAASGAVCTGDGRGLSQALSATIAGPPERNTAATGMPTISGTAQVGEALTASTSGVSDADGLDDARFAYQWIRAGADIGGATGATYTVVDADEGTRLTVRVSFTDDAGHEERLTSAATDAVAPPPNTPATGAPTIGGTAQVGEALTASTSGISDADGLDDARFGYQWIRTDTDIGGATGATYTVVDADEGERLKVRVDFTDDAGHEERLTSAATDAVAAAPEPLTASFEGMPAEHAGQGSFSFRVAFSDGIDVSYKTVRDASFTVTAGDVTRARRVDKRRDLWKITVEPDSDGAVTIRLPETTDCGATGAICTSDGRPLSHALSATVAGPVGIAVADARVEEGADAVLVFAVTLSRAASAALTVDYATADGSAHAGDDYRAASGTLTFAAGERSKTIEVGVLDDAHDEGEETLTLRLSNPSGGRLADGEATGTIENHDPMPQALLARFGRTAAVHVVEHVEERLQAPREPGFRGRFAGRELRRGMERDIALNFLRQLGGTAGAGPLGAGAGGQLSGAPAAGAAPLGMPGPAGGGGHLAAAGPMGGAALMGGASGSMGMASGPMGGGSGPDGRFDGGGLLRMGLGGGDVLTGSDFALGRETGHGGILSFWSRGAQSRFSGREGALSLGGDVRTTMFGADYAKGPVVTGLSLSHSRGLGEYAGVAGGQVASSVTGLYPWLGYKATERITVWGVAGYGAGGLRLTPQGGPALESGLSMAMAAAGTRGELFAGGGGFELAFKADALWVGTSIDGVDGAAGRMAATAAAVTRFRTGLEGSRDYTLAGRLSLKPSVEVGLRHDGGDAETGAGMDVGGGLVVSDASTGLAIDVRVRMLVMHQAEGFRERGMAVSLSYNPRPSTPLGFVARVAPSWGGQATSGAEALWGQETMGGLAHGSLAQGNRLDGEVGYGLPVGSRFVGTPTLGVGTSADGRDYRLGYRLGALGGAGTKFELGVEAHRRESPMLDTADNGFLGRATVGW